MQKKSTGKIYLFLGGLLLMGLSLAAATFTVNTTADTKDANPGDGIAADSNGKCSLRAAIMEANARDGIETIIVPVGTYKLTISGTGENDCKRGDLDITSDLNIYGSGRKFTVIDGNQLDRVFHVIGPCRAGIYDITVKNGKTPDGLYVDYWTGSLFAGNDGEPGGGICIDNFATLSIDTCSVFYNETGKGGCYYYGYGGSGGRGGGIYIYKGTLYIDDSSIAYNHTGSGNHGYYGGTSGAGGGIFNEAGTVKINTCTIGVNYTGTYGQGAEDGGSGNGGGIANHTSGTLKISDSIIRSNYTMDGGYEGTTGNGGGIYNSGLATVYRCQVSDNLTGSTLNIDCYGGNGGGLANYKGELTVINSTVSQNSTGPGVPVQGYGGHGGGISNDRGKTTLRSCTVTLNASNGGGGGGICNDPYLYGASDLFIHNTIIANNTCSLPNPDCLGKIYSEGYNLVELLLGCTISGNITGNIYNLDPWLDALKSNGGPTKTHALLPESPAIDTGEPRYYEPTDQRGISRPQDGNLDGYSRSDIGAYELVAK